MKPQIILYLLLAILAAVACQGQARIKDIANIQGDRSNQLIGYGLVVGLEGTGDSNSTIFTAQSVVNTLLKLGVNVPQNTVKVKNVAAVLVTANLPAFAKNGSRIDVTVNSIGDARSLQGGTLIQTPLQGADGSVYAVAQGPMSIGGFNFSSGGSGVQLNHVNVGRIPAGGIVEKEVPTSITDGKTIEITLNSPDFTTANRIAEVIRTKIPSTNAQAEDSTTVNVTIPDSQKSNLIGFISSLEGLTVDPDTAAKIVVDERTGTVVIGGTVKVSACAIAHGNLQVTVENTPVVAIPAPFTNGGKPVVVPQKSTTAKETSSKLAEIQSNTTIDDLVKALNALGVTPRDLIAILQTMHTAGYISAEIKVE
jgi:flagellar P-ring protein precursor FlgI